MWDTNLGSIFNLFEGVNEGDYNFWDQGIDPYGCKNVPDFFVELLLLQNRQFWPSEGPFQAENMKRCATWQYLNSLIPNYLITLINTH